MICPVPDHCTEDIELVGQLGSTNYTQIPIRLIDQNKTMVVFQVMNTFGVELERVFAQYHASEFGDTQCDQEFNVPVCLDNFTYAAYCMQRPITIIDLWIVSDEALTSGVDNAHIPECCKPNKTRTDAIAEYTFMIQCESKCIERE